MSEAKTLGELKKSGVAVLSVREEMRKNSRAPLERRAHPARHHRLRRHGHPGDRERDPRRPPHGVPRRARPGEEAHHPRPDWPARRAHPRRRGLRDQRRSRSRRSAAPAAPAADEGDALPIAWIDRDARYGEKLATPDVSMADLVGEIDPIKVAEGRYLADEETIHYGLVPRTNRGIFAINELPDLTEKVQVGLFNLMEEKDVQIKGYKIRLPLDVVIVASANPEDYTSRGRIITPLKDRFDVQIRTHYPRTLEDEIAIMEQEVPAVDRGSAPGARARSS